MKTNFEQLNKRQDLILNLMEKQEKSSVAGLILSLAEKLGKVSRITIIRDLNHLIAVGFINREGQGRGANYQLSSQYNLLKPINVEEYFKTEIDKRKGQTKFNFELLNFLKNVFIDEEKKYLQELLKEYKTNIKKLPKDIFKREFERIAIELSWKSSAIEGNTYTLLETEFLIKQGKMASGKKKEESVMILNHKYTLDYIRKNLADFKKVSIAKLDDIHYLLIKGLKIQKGLRKIPIGITGTIYRPLDNIYQIRESMEKMCRLVNKEKDIFSKALILMLVIAYIQPFNDGNKRTSRLAANAILMAYGACPLSYKNINEEEYKKAVILFYEQNNLNYFKRLFIEQFKFAVKNYFRIK